jgi:hypothetical protein
MPASVLWKIGRVASSAFAVLKASLQIPTMSPADSEMMSPGDTR